ncbi:CerR family C-terminal domain-containing protein [Xenophilus sp.]|uniref:CerR family C-terminal domain-containing protein n=1 Tax=Xenophilus sp. TaxID=1873499 RepID=UPI0037DC4CAF
MPIPPITAARGARSDGLEARKRLLLAALRLFAERGFAKTSTREIAQAAGANLAAISYYFGDKAGLYAACFSEPMGGSAGDLVALYDAPGLEVGEALRRFLSSYVEPLKRGEIVRQCMRLHMREMLEPTSQWAKEFERDIKGPHAALVRILCRHLGVKADDDIHRLALAITGLALQLFVANDFVLAVRPSLMRRAQDIDLWAQRLAQYAAALVEAEAKRRAPVPTPPAATRIRRTRARTTTA